MTHSYVHGYGARESERLRDQARTLVELLHGDTRYSPGGRVLEVGCGVGAQTVTLATRSPGAHITAIDISAASIAEARRRVAAAGLDNVAWLHGDIHALPLQPAGWDHAFICFVLEHVADPRALLERVAGLLVPGGTLTVIEGDHGLIAFHPDSEAAREAIDCQARLQRRAGGDASIGRSLYPLLAAAGFVGIEVEPRVAYADAGRPAWVDGFVRKTFIPMVEGVRDAAIAAGLSTPARFDQGVRDLYRTTSADGVFSYTFFKGVARRSRTTLA